MKKALQRGGLFLLGEGDIIDRIRSGCRSHNCFSHSLPGTGIPRPETTRSDLPHACNGCLQRPECRPQEPPIGGYLGVAGKSLVACECVVEDAATAEPVSSPKFPLNWKLSGIFAYFSPCHAVYWSIRRQSQMLVRDLLVTPHREMIRPYREFWSTHREFGPRDGKLAPC
jgi:hypothetical protein